MRNRVTLITNAWQCVVPVDYFAVISSREHAVVQSTTNNSLFVHRESVRLLQYTTHVFRQSAVVSNPISLEINLQYRANTISMARTEITY